MDSTTIIQIAAGFLFLFLYFLPSIIGRERRNAGTIFLVNLLTGWSIVGWIVALIWALTNDPVPVVSVQPQGAAYPSTQAAQGNQLVRLLGFVALVLVVLVIAVALVNHTPQTGTSTQDVAQQFAPVAIQVSAEQLYVDYAKNEVAADRVYKNRILAVSGSVQSINKDFVDDIYLVLDTSNEFDDVQAHLRSSEESRAASLSRGEFITVVCTGNGMIVSSPMLKDCVIQTSQQQQLEAANRQVQAQGTNPPAYSSAAPQEPTPVQLEASKPSAAQPETQPEPQPGAAEHPNPPAQPLSVAEIDQEAAALWNQKRYSEAMPLFNQACSGGKTNSCYYLGLMYDFGQGVAQDAARATAFYSKSCNAGDGAACFHLGMLRDYQPGSVICNSPAVNVTASRACDSGNAMSCTMLGYSYSYGCGVAKDIEKGRQLLSKGCALGYERACDGIK
jgi:hypothetical protein